MAREHRIRITWTEEAQHKGLPVRRREIHPPWRAGLVPTRDDGWSLVCRFDRPPSEQGNPSLGYAHFLMDDAPEEWLEAGSTLQLFEPATSKYARVEVLD